MFEYSHNRIKCAKRQSRKALEPNRPHEIREKKVDTSVSKTSLRSRKAAESEESDSFETGAQLRQRRCRDRQGEVVVKVAPPSCWPLESEK